MNDMLIVSKRKVKINKLKAQLNNGFVKYLEEAKKILGMKIQRDRRKGIICTDPILEENSTEIWCKWQDQTCKHTFSPSF
jgi:hypothetical protein